MVMMMVMVMVEDGELKMNIYILQGSVVTRLKRGGNYVKISRLIMPANNFFRKLDNVWGVL